MTQPLTKFYHLKMVQRAYQSQKWQIVIFHFTNALRLGHQLTPKQATLFNKAKQRYRVQRETMPLQAAVCGWDLSHNAAGRVLSLADLYRSADINVTIIGCLIEASHKRPKKLWQPMLLADIDCQYFKASNVTSLVNEAFNFVSSHPFDVVHLSKPRLPNIIIGRLYQLIWDARVIMDIDDEEMGFAVPLSTSAPQTEKKSPFSPIFNFNKPYSKFKSLLQLSLKQSSKLKKRGFETIRSTHWLTKSVNYASSFTALTTSNIALEAKYGGEVFPHVRDANLLVPSQTLTSRMRQKYGIHPAQQVVLFFGTPKPHKGLIETAQALSRIPDSDILFLIIGNFVDLAFKKALCAVDNVNFKFLPDQPYDRISDFVAMGDVCVCLQDTESLISQHQLPAKIIDALAMKLIVVASVTPALMPLINANVIIPTDKQHLDKTLERAFLATKSSHITQQNRRYFVENLSTHVYVPKLKKLLNGLEFRGFPIQSNLLYDLDFLTSSNLS